MKLLYGQDRLVANWVAENIPHLAPYIPEKGYGEVFGPGVAIGVIDRNGILIGGVVYHSYDPHCRSIEMSSAATSRRWLTRGVLFGLFHYPFIQLGCQRITCITPKGSKDARKFLDDFGFKREGVVRRGFGRDDAMIMGLLRKEWERGPFSRPQGVKVVSEPAPR